MMADPTEKMELQPLQIEGLVCTNGTDSTELLQGMSVVTVPTEQLQDRNGMQVEIVTSNVIYQSDANTQTENDSPATVVKTEFQREVSTQTNVSTHNLEGLSLLVDTAMQTEIKKGDKKQAKLEKVPKRGVTIKNLQMVHHEEIRGALEDLEKDFHKCYICGKVYKNKANWQNHLKVHAGEQVFLCGYCGKLFQKSALASHVKSHNIDKLTDPSTSSTVQQTDQGQPDSESIQNTEIHIQTDSNDAAQEIVIQGLYGADQNDIPHIQQIYSAEVAQQTQTEELPDQTEQQQQILYPSQIDLGKLQDATVIDLGIIDVAMQAEVLSSSETPQPIHDEEEVVSEMPEGQDGDPDYPKEEQDEKTKYIYKCNLCGKEYNNKSNCHRHLRSHTQEKSHQCQVCEKQFTHRYELRMHSRIHTGEKPHKCPICTRAFNEGGNLRRHMKIHIGDDRPYKCAVCYKGFEDTARLQVHTKIHTKNRPFECDTCGKTMAKISDLYRHIRIHTGEKPFICDVCDKSFCQKVNLQTHMRTHTGEKPFRCKICSIGFSRKKSYVTHMNGHEEDSDYEEVMKNCEELKEESFDKEAENKETPNVGDVLNQESNILEIAGTIVVGNKTYTLHQNANNQNTLVLKPDGGNCDNGGDDDNEVGEVVVYEARDVNIDESSVVQSDQEAVKNPEIADWAMYVTEEQVVIENTVPTQDAVMEIN